MSTDENRTETSDFVLYPNPYYGRGVPPGEPGTVMLEGRRLPAVRQIDRIWVQVITDPAEWFVAISPQTRATFERQT